jgi:hypothetical protein
VRSGGIARAQFRGASHAPLLSAIFGMTAGNDFALLPSDLTVFHYAGGEVQQDKLAGRSIQTVPSEDALYFVVTDQSKHRKVWTWQESHLVAVLDPTAEELLKTADDQADSEDEDAAPTLPQGWHRSSLYAGRNGARAIDVPLRAAKATIKIEQPKVDVKSHTFPQRSSPSKLRLSTCHCRSQAASSTEQKTSPQPSLLRIARRIRRPAFDAVPPALPSRYRNTSSIC